MDSSQADRLANGFADWAAEQPSVRAAAIMGSWARGAARPSSDLDVLAVVDVPDFWAGDNRWIQHIVTNLGFSAGRASFETYGVATSLRMFLGSDVELELTLVGPDWAAVDPLDDGTRRVVGDGMRVLVDKDGALARLQAAVVEVEHRR